VRFGKPLDFSRYEGMEEDRYILRSITDEIMYEIMALSGQEYVDMYATTAREQFQAAQKAAKAGEKPHAVVVPDQDPDLEVSHEMLTGDGQVSPNGSGPTGEDSSPAEQSSRIQE
jgi:1-acyl-sn-glycerol-3-phosphate acyltransferase